jgi:hypothetical protein
MGIFKRVRELERRLDQLEEYHSAHVHGVFNRQADILEVLIKEFGFKPIYRSADGAGFIRPIGIKQREEQ